MTNTSKVYTIYCHLNKINGKRYIGMSMFSMEKRWDEHVYLALNNKYNFIFYKAIRKYGAGDDIWEHKILELCSSEKEAKDAEIKWIKQFNTNINNESGYGYNMTDGGEGTSGRPQTEESKSKISKTRKDLGLARGEKNPMFGKRGENSPIYRDKNGFYGKIHSEESKKRMSNANKGNQFALGAIRSEETKRKLSEANKGKIQSEEQRKKQSVFMTGNKYSLGFKHSEETKKKWSEMRRGEKNGNTKLSQSEVDLIREEYAKGEITQNELAKKYNVTRGAIGGILHNKTWKKND